MIFIHFTTSLLPPRPDSHWSSPSTCIDSRATFTNEMEQDISTTILLFIHLKHIYILSLVQYVFVRWNSGNPSTVNTSMSPRKPTIVNPFVAHHFGNKSVLLNSFNNRWIPYFNGSSYLYQFLVYLSHLPNASHSTFHLGIFC